MAVITLIMGDSGSGKTASLRNFTGKEATIFNIAKKPLPFKNAGEEKIPLVEIAGYEELKTKLAKARNKSLIVDDAQYLMAFEFFGSIEEKGFEKFTRMGKRQNHILFYAQRNYRRRLRKSQNTRQAIRRKTHP